MGAHYCGVNHNPFHISICRKGIEDHLRYTGFGTSYQPFVNTRQFFVKFWQCTPRCILLGNPHHGIDKFLVIALPARPEFLSFSGKLSFIPSYWSSRIPCNLISCCN
ncbi:hypothetical protein HCUR_00934 [Holospora curviuscula]|uniref:Uncharacterized protein n=1 Tax=Holospora curviuscula TaxID=1082868 RepID=A0A2S5R8I5_9PROT|nr:hypothetical protein [Holospora curviuscula]PPE03607.1 hypothetical protein HCUR_00934 [Holospora curviuscula]